MIFSTYKEVGGENSYIENSLISKILGVTKIILKIISGRLLIFNNVLFVNDIKKNSVSSSLLRQK
jgi:hypothetical protein